jgi:hypothetical protein
LNFLESRSLFDPENPLLLGVNPKLLWIRKLHILYKLVSVCLWISILRYKAIK